VDDIDRLDTTNQRTVSVHCDGNQSPANQMIASIFKLLTTNQIAIRGLILQPMRTKVFLLFIDKYQLFSSSTVATDDGVTPENVLAILNKS